MEGEGIQPVGECVEGLSRILTVEEFGIGVTGANDALIALPHYVGMVQIVGIGDGDKTRRECSGTVPKPERFGKDREVALVFFHHRCQNRLRKVQEALFEGADNGLRRFHQICDLV